MQEKRAATAVFEPDGSVQTPLEAGWSFFASFFVPPNPSTAVFEPDGSVQKRSEPDIPILDALRHHGERPMNRAFHREMQNVPL